MKNNFPWKDVGYPGNDQLHKYAFNPMHEAARLLLLDAQALWPEVSKRRREQLGNLASQLSHLAQLQHVPGWNWAFGEMFEGQHSLFIFHPQRSFLYAHQREKVEPSSEGANYLIASAINLLMSNRNEYGKFADDIIEELSEFPGGCSDITLQPAAICALEQMGAWMECERLGYMWAMVEDYRREKKSELRSAWWYVKEHCEREATRIFPAFLELLPIQLQTKALITQVHEPGLVFAHGESNSYGEKCFKAGKETVVTLMKSFLQGVDQLDFVHSLTERAGQKPPEPKPEPEMV